MSIGSDVREQAQDLEANTKPARFSSEIVPYFLAMADAGVILASSLVGAVGYQLSAGYPMPELLPICTVGLLAAFIQILRMSGSDYYDFPECARPRVEFGEILVCWFTTGLLLALFAFLLKVGVDYSRGAFVAFYFIAPIGLLGIRKLTKTGLGAGLSTGTIGRRDVVLLGDPTELTSFEPADYLAFFGSPNVQRFLLSSDPEPAVRALEDSRILDQMESFVRRHECREVLLALPWTDGERIEIVREHVKNLPVAVRLMPDTRVKSLTNYRSSVRQRILAIEIQRAPLNRLERLVKRLMDIVGASLALTFFLPVMIVAAIAIKLDSRGPVIFRQKRNGFNGRQFVMYKFRTMTVEEDGAHVTQATRDDPRVTDVGRLLRSASVDELPQLINVLKGDMSLIGPRPHALVHDSHFETLLRDYAFRHHVKPGITGWAQCNGARGATPSVDHIAERVKFDLWYINNWSLWLDIQIILKTFFEVLRKRNAY
jgi:undecaprenyl-phosphate glucose phosphotransferase